MSIAYNGRPFQESNRVALADIPTEPLELPVNVTYMTGWHTTRRDFDKTWQRSVIKSADVVMHEDFGWTKEYHRIINHVARGALRSSALDLEKDSFEKAKIDAISGTGIKQEFWDLSDDLVIQTRIEHTFADSLSASDEAIELIREGNVSQALAKQAFANSRLAEFGFIRDSVGIVRIINTANSLKEKTDIANIAIFAGYAHIFQGIALDQKDFAEDITISAVSRIEDPVDAEYIVGRNYLTGKATTEGETAKYWLSSIEQMNFFDRNPQLTRAHATNHARRIVMPLSDDEAIGRLTTMLSTK